MLALPLPLKKERKLKHMSRKTIHVLPHHSNGLVDCDDGATEVELYIVDAKSVGR